MWNELLVAGLIIHGGDSPNDRSFSVRTLEAKIERPCRGESNQLRTDPFAVPDSSLLVSEQSDVVSAAEEEVSYGPAGEGRVLRGPQRKRRRCL